MIACTGCPASLKLRRGKPDAGLKDLISHLRFEMTVYWMRFFLAPLLRMTILSTLMIWVRELCAWTLVRLLPLFRGVQILRTLVFVPHIGGGKKKTGFPITRSGMTRTIHPSRASGCAVLKHETLNRS